jgi:hypothetical protein
MSMSGPGLGEAFGKWSTRIFMAFFTYLTTPVLMVLYPIAGAPALFVGYQVLHASSRVMFGFDDIMSYAWTTAWLVMLPLIRLETTIEKYIPGYRLLRHLWRVLAGAGWLYYVSITDQGVPPGTALLTALIVAIPIHFFLRASLTKGMWDALSGVFWLRK